MQIPVDADEIPCQEEVQRWRHLNQIAHLIPLKEEIPIPSVTLLIGGNCPQVLEPKDVIQSVNNGPYAVKYTLGWYVAEPRPPKFEISELSCHRIVVRETETGTVAKPQFVLEKVIKERSLEEMWTALYEHDFTEPQLKTGVSGTKALSFNDQKFLKIMGNAGKKVSSGHTSFQYRLYSTTQCFQTTDTRQRNELVG